jgi:signal recognition particle GTPase
MFLGSFTLADFLGLIDKVRSMGSIRDLLGMVPGLGANIQNLNVDESEFDRSRAIIHSMTLKERNHPEILNVSRRERVAQGSGTSVEQVNVLLKNFKTMKKQLQSMRKMGFLGGLLDPTRGLRKEKQQELDRMRALGVNPLNVTQVKAFKQHVQRVERAKARKNKKKRR